MVAVERYLAGRIAIITGGFAGIGKAIAIALAERGAIIAVGARRQPEAAIEELRAVSNGFFYQKLDAADIDSINAFVEALAAFLCHVEALGITMEDIQVNAGALW